MSDLISVLKARQNELAHSALTAPKRDPFDHGLQAGEYMGIEYAITAFLNLSAPKPTPAPARQAVYS